MANQICGDGRILGGWPEWLWRIGGGFMMYKEVVVSGLLEIMERIKEEEKK